MPTGKPDPRNRDLTAAEAARLLTISPQTVKRSIDRGDLKGYRVPGSRYHRVPRAAAMEFARRHGMSHVEGYYDIDIEAGARTPAG